MYNPGRSSENVLYQDLPSGYLPESNQTSHNEDFLARLLGKELSSNDSQRIGKDISVPFFLSKDFAIKRKRSKRGAHKKKTFLTRKERGELGILKLPKNGWNYESLHSMREMWKNYMEENLDLVDGKMPPGYADPEWANFSLVLTRSELTGAEVTVVRSKIPSQVGITGTVVLETKQTFQIVTLDSKIKIIAKDTAVFEFKVKNLKITVFGKHLMMKPSERSVKKIKTQSLPDI